MIKCAACHNEMKQKNGDIDLRIGKQLYFVRNVSYDECSVCGEKVLSSEVCQAL
jgi:YgiT-type zinc finger domain-containing protein